MLVSWLILSCAQRLGQAQATTAHTVDVKFFQHLPQYFPDRLIWPHTVGVVGILVVRFSGTFEGSEDSHDL